MKLFNQPKFWALTTIALAVGYVVSCTKADQVITQPSTITTNSGKDLVSVKVATAPTIDGTIDASWDLATKLNIKPTAPDPGNNLFTGYIGNSYNVSLRSLYDDQYIYFLAEWADNTHSVNPSPWYFDPILKLWAQEPNSKSFDVNGNLVRDGFGEDRIAMLWNIDNSTSKFAAQTCYASCHVFTPYMDYSVTPAVMNANANGNHYTNGVNEKIDMWWAHLSKDLVFNQMDDNYQDWSGGPGVTSLVGGNGNGRHVDGISVSGKSTTWPFKPTYTTSPAQGSSNNKQSLKLDGTGATVSVPLYIKPNASSYYYILATDTASASVARVTGVSSTGVLSYNGGTIDPNVGTDYQRIGDAVFGTDGPKCFPSYIASPLIGERADITCSAVYTGTGWVVEYKRKLKTADTLKQDIDFTSLQDQPFGVAVWDNSNYQHCIQPNLLLKFQK
jgi:hypothetical protein